MQKVNCYLVGILYNGLPMKRLISKVHLNCIKHTRYLVYRDSQDNCPLLVIQPNVLKSFIEAKQYRVVELLEEIHGCRVTQVVDVGLRQAAQIVACHETTKIEQIGDTVILHLSSFKEDQDIVPLSELYEGELTEDEEEIIEAAMRYTDEGSLDD